MAETELYHVIPATATATPKDPTANQDRALAVKAADGSVCIVVCDGVGSYASSGDTAEAAVSAVRAFIQSKKEVDDGIGGCVRAAADALRTDTDGATTMLVAIANPKGLVSFGIVGNGALFELKPAESVVGRWQLHLNELSFAQMSYERGRPALRSFLPSPDNQPVFEAGTRRLPPGQARIFVACTDGLVCEDSPRVLPDADGNLWKEVPRQLSTILHGIIESYEAIVSSATPERDLATCLQDALDSLALAGRLDDDASVAALFLRPNAGEPEQS